MDMVCYSRMRGSQDYSGRETFNFSILRYRNPETRKLVLYENVKEDCDEIEISLTITASASFKEGCSYGEPSDCYPDEEDFEIEEVMDLTNNQILDPLSKI